MKLKEIMSKPLLKQEIDQETIDYINETLDRSLEYKQVKSNKTQSYHEIWYDLKCDPTITVYIRRTYFDKRVIADVSFFSKDHEFKSLGTFGTGGALSVLTTVIKLCENFFNEVDTWFFTAKLTEYKNAKELERKTDLYNRIAERVARKHGMFLFNVKIKNGDAWVVSKEKVQNDEINKFIKFSLTLHS